MTKINISVIGLDKVMKDLSERGRKAQEKADRITEKYTRKMANEAGKAAPVKSGDLRANVIASPRRLKVGLWEFGGTLAYARRQEYEHKSHKGFIRKAVWNNRQAYRDELRKEVIKK